VHPECLRSVTLRSSCAPRIFTKCDTQEQLCTQKFSLCIEGGGGGGLITHMVFKIICAKGRNFFD
jgi:hypothetical protein